MLRRTILGVAALAAVAGFGTVPARAADQPIRFGVAAEPYPPFTSQEASGKWVGFEVDLMDAVCAAMKAKCVIVPTAWDGIIPALNANKIDLIWSSMSITDERKKVIDFSDKYYSTPAEIVAAKSLPLKLTLTDASALKGKVIGVQTSTTHANYIQKHFRDLVTVKTYDTQDNANADLAAGRVDAIQADSTTLDDFLKTDAGKDYEVKLLIPNSSDPAVLGDGVGAGLRKSDTALRDKVNAAIKQVRADGTYDKIEKKYFAYDVYGG